MPRTIALSEQSLAVWQRLYQAALAFRDQAPWTQLTDVAVFAVELPGTEGEVAYCSVMGEGGLEYGLVAYRGIPGLLAYTLMTSEALDEDEMLLMQDCLTFTLADREHLNDADRAVQTALGLRFRGRGAWPLFRTYRPNFLPAELEAGELETLALCLEQTCLLATETNSGILHDPADDEIVARRRNEQGAWETGVLRPPPVTFTIAFDREFLEEIPRHCERVAQSWEVRVLAIARIAEERGVPAYWGRMLLCVDAKSGIIYPSNVLGPDEGVQNALLDVMDRAGVIPGTLRITSALLEDQLSPITSALRIKVQRVARLPKLDAAARTLKRRFG